MRILRYLENDGRVRIVPDKMRDLSHAGGGFFLADHPAVFELDDTVAEGGVALGVGDLNDGGAAFVQAFEELHDLFALCGVKVSRGLVGENELGILDDRASDADQLLLTARKLVGKEIFLADDVEAVEDVADQADALFVGHILIRERDFQIFEDSKIVDQVIALKNEADIGFVQLVAFFDVELVDRLIEEIVFAGPSTVEHAYDAQQRGFPGAGRSHEGDKLTLLNVDVDTAKHKKFAAAGLEGLLQVSQLNQRFHKLSLGSNELCSSVPSAERSLYS